MKNKNVLYILVIILIGLSVIYLIRKSDGLDQTTNQPGITDIQKEIISQNGLHWHSTVDIYVKGQKLTIPPNLGLIGQHNPVHTHNEDAAAGVVHMEFPGTVRNRDIMLGRFFEIFGRDMRSLGSNMTMTVNGQSNTDFENYIMQDGDKIELRFD